jgi:hypothetical protein
VPWPAAESRPANQPFQNSPALEHARTSSYRQLLAELAPAGAVTPARQRLDQLVSGIETRLREVTPENAQASVDALRAQIDAIVQTDGAAALNQLGGPLSQPPLVVAVTGPNGAGPNPAARADLRKAIVELLVRAGADPMVEERHPMAVDAFIRALVFNHLDEVRIMASSPAMTPERLAEALNRQPRVNGLTGVHDTVLRSTTAPAEQLPAFLNQIQWVVEHGARVDLPDFSGRTQRAIAEQARDNPNASPQVRANGAAVVALLDALTGTGDAYTPAPPRPAPLAPETHTTLQIATAALRVTVGGRGVGDSAIATNNISQTFIPYRADHALQGGRSIIVEVHPDRNTVDFSVPVNGELRLV